MSQPLHPRENPDLTGHEDAETQFLDAWTAGRMHHGWLISGPKGIGKATLAYRFARFLLTHGHPPEQEDTGPALFGDDDIQAAGPVSLAIDPDNPVFHRIAANGHADLQVIERGLSDDGKRMQTIIPVDKIRAVGHTMSLTAGEGGWRVIIVDGAEDMNPNAANALLKVLEEPPPRAILFLITHAPGRLLPTIRSRCRQLKLSALEPRQVNALLAQRLPSLSETERNTLVRLSDGSIGRALDLAESDGVALQRDLLHLMNSLPTLDMATAHKFADRVARRDADSAWRTAVDLASRGIADIVASGTREQGIEGRGYLPEEAACLGRLSALAPAQRWIEAWEKNNALFARADSANLDRKQVMLHALTTMENVARTGV
jgi:DNA polymerase-3 subunit delta'